MMRSLESSKQPFGAATPPSAATRRQVFSRVRMFIIIIILLLSFSVLHSRDRIASLLFPGSSSFRPPNNSPGGANQPFPAELIDWNAVQPSEDLEWVPCYRFVDEFYCARLTVPLDYGQPRGRDKVHIALVLLPGRGHSTATGRWSESPLLVNPGGPGGSGTVFALGAARRLQAIVGTHHDVVGFDPRGMGATTPSANCFLPPPNATSTRPPNASSPLPSEPDEPSPDRQAQKDALLRRLVWLQDQVVTGLPNSSDVATARMLARHRALNRLCRDAADGGRQIFEYAGTPHVAQDMLSIVQAWDRWLGQQDAGSSVEASMADREQEHAQDSTASASPASTRGKLVYWGFSYGSVLGATFAIMFPDSVGRVVLDGVVNTDDWYYGNRWVRAVEDTDKGLAQFFHYCLQAQARCALWREGDTVSDLQRRYQGILDDLRESPRPFVNPQTHMPGLVSYSDIKTLAFAVMYAPSAFRTLALVLSLLHDHKDLGLLANPTDLAVLCRLGGHLPVYPSDGGLNVVCVDMLGKFDDSKAGLDEYAEQLYNVSSFADVIFQIGTNCAGWTIPRRDPPSIDWSTFPNETSPPLKTAFPLLIVSNTHDPVTPKRSGLHQAVRRFAGAGFVEQASEGHCSLAAASLCTTRHIAAYFNDGVVPPHPILYDDDDNDEGNGRHDWDQIGSPMRGKWTVCQVDDTPWSASREAEARFEKEEDLERFRALRELQFQFRVTDQFVTLPRMFYNVFLLGDDKLDELEAKVRGT